MLTDHFRKQNIQVVATPTTDGIILAFETARQLGVRDIFTERKGTTERVFRRGFSINPEERVLIVDDILTTGSSIRQVMAAVTKQCGIAIGIGVLVDRSEPRVEFSVPLFSYLRSITPPYTSQDYPLYATHIPLVKPGGS